MSGEWAIIPKGLKLERGEVHIFLTSTGPAAATRNYFESLLTEEEQKRVERFRIPEKRAEALVSRGFLRHVLALFLKIPPTQIVFSVTSQGKPILASGSLFFNLSHTAGWTAVAVSGDGEIGVDMECLSREGEFESLAERFFTAGEFAALRALPSEERATAFLRCWTRKEAVLKATGKGISGGLDSIEAPIGPAQAPIRVGQWNLHDLPLMGNYVGALATESDEATLHFWSYE